MTLIVQDTTTPTTTANSYLSLVDWQARATELGLSEPTEAQILTGMLYVDSNTFIGETVVAFQSTAWPRSSVIIFHGNDYVEYDKDAIPQQVIDAVLYAAVEPDLYQTAQGGQRVKMKKVDVLEKEFFDDGVNATAFKRVSRADAMLKPFLSKSGGGFNNMVWTV